MNLEYICNECGREISSIQYEELSDIFCPECGGHIEENTEKIWCFLDANGQLTGPFYNTDLRKAFLNKELHEETDIFRLDTSESKPLKNWDSLKHITKPEPPPPESPDATIAEDNTKQTLLVTCESCSHKFSKRAEACPKCGWKPKEMCQICQQKIPFDSSVCPECGDPRPFELQEKSKQMTPAPNEKKEQVSKAPQNTLSQLNESINENQKIANKPHTKGFSWKSFLAAFLIAAFLNVFISAAAGVELRKNIAWTAFWIYLSIESWKYWKWKALLPYPLFLVVSFALQAIVASTGNERLSWAYITVMLVSNIGGLTIFYMLFRKSQKQAHHVTY